jgi:dCMP deaminase
MDKWDSRYLQLAENVSQWSKDPSTKIGAVIIGEKGQVLSTGYNGFPRHIHDREDRLSNREIKYKYVVHAEMNAIYNAAYNGISLRNSTMYVIGLPCCSECAKGIIQCGLTRVVMKGDHLNERWKESIGLTVDMFKEAGIEYEFI